MKSYITTLGMALLSILALPMWGQAQDVLNVAAKIRLVPDTRKGVIEISTQIAEGWKTYSITQPAGGPKKTTFKFADSPGVTIGEFSADQKPESAKSSDFDVPVEYHASSVKWTAPIEIAENVDLENLQVDLVYSAMACEAKENGTCKNFPKIDVSAKFAGFDPKLTAANTTSAATIKLAPYAPKRSHVTITGKLYHPEGKPIQAGNKVKLALSVKATGDFHVYDYRKAGENVDYLPTRVGFIGAEGWTIEGPTASTEAHSDNSGGFNVRYHDKEVTWTFDVTVPQAATGKTSLTGILGVQSCNGETCDPPTGVSFQFEFEPGQSSAVAASFEEATYGKAKAAQALPQE